MSGDLTMMSYGYVRASDELTIAQQRQQVFAYYQQHLSGSEWGGTFEDELNWCEFPMDRRPEGHKLLLMLQDGDHLIIARAALAFTTLPLGAVLLAKLSKR